MKHKDFTEYEKLEAYIEKLTNKYWMIKYEILFIHNWYRLLRCKIW
jgi:hypothetical protein